MLVELRRVSEARYRMGLSALLACVLVISTVCVQASLEWIDRPFNGFLMSRNRVVSPVALRHWSGEAAGVPHRAQLVAIDGQPLSSVQEALSQAAEAGVGTTLRYSFVRDGELLVRDVEVMPFGHADYLALFAGHLFNGIAFLLMGFLVAFLRPRVEAAQAMLVLSLSYGMGLIISLADFDGFYFRNLYAIAHAAAPATVLYLAASFPTEQPWLHRRKIRVFLLISTAVLAAVDVTLYDAAPELWARYFDFSLLWLALALMLGVVLMWNQYRSAPSPIGREKIKVVFLGAIVAFALPSLVIVGSYLIGAEYPAHVLPAASWLFPAALAYAIVKRDLFEIDVFLRRAAAYVALSAAVLLLHAALVALLSRAFYNSSPADSPWFTLVFTLLIIVLVRPFWDWLQGWIDRVFFRTRFDYAEIIQSVSQALTRTLDTQEITGHVQRAVAQTMAPTACRLYIGVADDASFHCADRPGSALELEAAARQALAAGEILDAPGVAMLVGRRLPLDVALLVPVCFETQLEGVLVLGPKKSGAVYGPRDLELLRTLANQTAIALRNAISYRRVSELLTSLEARVEERTRELQETQAELQATNQKLRELDRLKTQFFSDASHELRTPLTLVLGPLEEIRRQAGDLPSGLGRLVDLAHSNAAKLLVLTDTLLDLSRLDAGRMQPNLQIEQLGPLVERTAEPFRWLAEQRGLFFQLRHTQDPATVSCDAAMISKIIGNLLANALKFTVSGGIRVMLESGEGRVGVRVTDTGPGIPAAELPTIFDRYQQASTASRSALGGTGLGLALVRELTELHGGSIEVSSEEGRGTSLVVWLPAANSSPRLSAGRNGLPPTELPTVNLAALAAAGLSPAPAASPREDRPHVRPDAPLLVVVDDNPNMLEFLRDLLSRDYRVKTAANAVAALALLRAQRPHLILSDVMMPGPDGVAFCKAVKHDESLRHIPVILLTARASVESKITGLEAGADDYVTKPFHPDELKARIASLLRMRQIERELRRSHTRLGRAYDELRETQLKLIQAEKLASIGTLVAGVAHEINNPISFINSSIDLISISVAEVREILDRHLQGNGREEAALRALRDELDYEYRFDMLQQNASICRDGASRAARIVTDLRTFSRPASGHYEPADLHEQLERSLRLLQGEYKNRITVHRQYGELPLVLCDAGQVGQVFMNLLSNAAQAIEGSGDIYVRTRRDKRTVHVEIEDTGGGMDDTVLARVFDPFFTTKQVGKGTGLGLSICRSLLTAHGGDIQARSIPGRGSVFTVTLPIYGAPHDERNTQALDAGSRPPDRR